MNKTLEGMARAEFYARSADGWSYDEMCEQIPNGFHEENIEVVRAALLWLADNVSDEMLEAAAGRLPHFANLAELDVKDALSAALRAAAGGGE